MIEVDERPSPGVNLIGYLDAELGLGEISRKLARMLAHARIPFAAIPYGGTPSRREHRLDVPTTNSAPFDTNIVCLNADEIGAFAGEAGLEVFARRYSIGIWFWETSIFRDVGADLFFDEIWTTSGYVREAVSQRVGAPVHLAPIPFEAPPPPVFSREDLGIPGGFVFLFLFDFVSGERKNPNGLVTAFCDAFQPGEGPKLVLKSINGRERSPRQLDDLLAATSDRPDIFVHDGYVSAEERDSIVAACDCFVSLHRSEGLGLTMAEAISHGKPVIATGYSGNAEFMDDGTSYLVPYRLVEVPPSWWAHEPGAVWAEPDLARAAAAMRHVWEHPEEASARAQCARDQLFERFSVGKASRFLEERLGAVRARRALTTATRPYGARSSILETASALGQPIGGALEDGGRVASTSVARRLARRTLWPQLVEDRRVNAALLDAISSLQRCVYDLEERIRRLEGEQYGRIGGSEGWPSRPQTPDDSFQ